MKNIYQLLEFNEVITKILPLSLTERGKQRISNLEMVPVNELSFELTRLGEMMGILSRFGPWPLSSSKDLSLIFQKVDKGGILSIAEISSVAEDITTVTKIIDYFSGFKKDYPLIGQQVDSFERLGHILQQINRIIAPNLTILDEASPELKSIRGKKRNLENKISFQIQKLLVQHKSLLTDKQATIRNGHLVLPILTSEKYSVEGIIHDISDSGRTTFVEPTSVIVLNNQMYVLTQEENEEIIRLLTILTELLGTKKNEILSNNYLIGYLDFIQAKAIYGDSTRSYVGIIEDKPIIELTNARHPLIDDKKVVANNFHLDLDKRIMIISGPNAGGKTVAIKTLGICVLMHQCGLALPTSRPAILGYFNHIYGDIGDSQNIQENLSTFAGHISNIVELSRHVESHDLVLIDELGTGTDPQEGEALATALLNYLQSKMAFAAVSSHFSGLKQLAFTQPHMVNASMRFDEEKLQPTYELLLGLPGKSYGLTMAERYGLNSSIVQEARNVIASNGRPEINRTLETLEGQLIEMRQQKKVLDDERASLESAKIALQLKVDKLERERAKFKNEFELEKDKLLFETKEKVDRVIKALANPDVKLHEVISLKADLEDKTTSEDEEIEEEIFIGDYVMHKDVNIYGKVVKISKRTINVITTDGKSMSFSPGSLTKTDQPLEVKKTIAPPSIRIGEGVPLELNIIGLFVEEALEAVDKYLDSALMTGHGQVRLIHGFGSGALRNAVHKYLKTKTFVVSFRLGNQGEGSHGATVVYLK